MRTTCRILVSGLLLLPAGAFAQSGPDGGEASEPRENTIASPGQSLILPSGNFIDVGVRGTTFGSGDDQARFQRYRDLRNGVTLDLFRWKDDNADRGFNLQADHVGYRDQRYSASYHRYGKVKTTFEWNQTPLFFSKNTMTLYTTESPGVLRISDALQSGVQNKTTTIGAALTQAQPFELRLRRDVLDWRLIYSATPNLDAILSVRNTNKTGQQPWAGTFGFSDAVELPAPVDTRTTELGAALEWGNSRGSARVGYDGSFFRNHIASLTWDNPLRVSDATAGPAQGRMALWPNSDVNAVSGSGAVNLPYRSRATAFLSVGNWSQNDTLIPFTINSALAAPALSRASADTKATVTSANVTFSSRPTDMLWFSARFRTYDFDNKTKPFLLSQTVTYDTTVSAYAEGQSDPFSFTRRAVDVEASVTPVKRTSFRAGYTRENLHQTFRSFDTTTEDVVRLSADTTALDWMVVRFVYEHGRRVGTGFDEQALDDIGEQVSLRQFDISDKLTDRVSAIVQVTPFSSFSINGMVAGGREDRNGAVFGLRNNDNRSYSLGFDYVPTKTVSMGLSYEYDKYTALQASRQANPGAQFIDPTRDWTTDSADRTHTVTAGLDLLKLLPKTDIRFAYNMSLAESVYVYGVPANSTITPVPQQLPAVKNRFHRATADMRYSFTKHLGMGLAYWLDRYRVEDFALDQNTLTTTSQPSFVMLGYLYRPYTANSLMARLTYFW